MSRTRFSTTQKRVDGKRQYGTLLLPSFSERSDDIIINVNRSTRMDVLAQQFFGDATMWWVIAVYNNMGEASLHVGENVSFLRIPNDIKTVFDSITNLN